MDRTKEITKEKSKAINKTIVLFDVAYSKLLKNNKEKNIGIVVVTIGE